MLLKLKAALRFQMFVTELKDREKMEDTTLLTTQDAWETAFWNRSLSLYPPDPTKVHRGHVDNLSLWKSEKCRAVTPHIDNESANFTPEPQKPLPQKSGEFPDNFREFGSRLSSSLSHPRTSNVISRIVSIRSPCMALWWRVERDDGRFLSVLFSCRNNVIRWGWRIFGAQPNILAKCQPLCNLCTTCE